MRNRARTASGSIGFQLGAQAKSIVIAFMTQEALDKFRASDGWKVGVDGSVALILDAAAIVKRAQGALRAAA